jgi:DNA-binding response OmpR family regulator
MKIVAVDDDPLILDAVAVTLARDGRSIRVFTDPAEALLALATDPADLLVLDVRMPSLDGLAFLRALASRGVAEGMRILMLTGVEDLDAILKARDLGASGYLVKPFAPAQLADAVDRLIRNPKISWIDDHHTVTSAR